ncbi:hypothetical protein Tco_0496352 [Tanacetum coccineum]
MEVDDQAIQTILLGLPEDIYVAVDSCETTQEIWLRVQQIMNGSDIGIQEKKAKLFNEWERFTSTDGELIESYYHRVSKLMNDFKRNKHFPEKIASNLKFLNNLQREWSLHVIIVHQTKDLHTADYTQLDCQHGTYTTGRGGRVDEMILARVLSGFAGEKYGVTYKLHLGPLLMENGMCIQAHTNEPLAVPLDGLHLDDKLHFVEEPLEIVGREVKRLKRSRIPLVKVRWNSKRGLEFTWEREDQFKKKYPHLFTKTSPSSSAAS